MDRKSKSIDAVHPFCFVAIIIIVIGALVYFISEGMIASEKEFMRKKENPIAEYEFFGKWKTSLHEIEIDGVRYLVTIEGFVPRAISADRDATTLFEMMGPHLEDGLYRVEYEGKVYLLYHVHQSCFMIEHRARQERP